MCLFWSSRTKKSPLNTPTLTPDMDRTVSRRSEPSSRTALAGEQPDPWNVLPLQVAMSRHRGAKPPRRYELSEKISLLAKVMVIYYLYNICIPRHRTVRTIFTVYGSSATLANTWINY